MGNVLNWRMPIEWDDGTACELEPQTQESLDRGENRSFYLVRSAHEPRGWNRRTMPKLGMTKPITVDPDGTIDCARGPGAPRIVNTQMPLLRFEDGTEPKQGRIVDDGTRLVLQTQAGRAHSYSWPRLAPGKGAPPLIVITPAMVAAQEKAEEEQAAMEDSPFFGAF